MKNKLNFFILIIFNISLLLFDQLSKILIVDQNINILPNFLNLVYTKNYGIAFSIGSKMNYLIIFFNIILLTIILILILKNNKKPLLFYSLNLVFLGGIGNLIDRFFYGYVIDFIDINLFNFPYFNLADIYIFIGCILISIYIIKDFIKKDGEH